MDEKGREWMGERMKGDGWMRGREGMGGGIDGRENGWDGEVRG